MVVATREPLLRSLTEWPRLDEAARSECRERIARLVQAPEPEVESLVLGLRDWAAENTSSEISRAHEGALLALIEQLRLRYLKPEPARISTRPVPSPKLIDAIAELHNHLSSSAAQHGLLRMLTTSGDEQSLRRFVEIITRGSSNDQEWSDAKQVDLVFAPLFQQPMLAVQALFPDLLQAIGNPNVAVQVFDLANHLTRAGLVSPHPAAGRVEQLLPLFSTLVHRLHDLPQKPQEFGATPKAISETVGRCLEHVVAMCDALGLIGDERAIGKLRQALSLPHRRIRTEAAAALARLGDKSGVDALVQLANEPSVRRRAIAYLDELGQVERVPEELRTDIAAAEGEIASWLAEPAQIGLAPQQLELIDQRNQAWPGYSQTVNCYLFRFEYHLPRGTFRSVGIVGPVVHAFSTDLSGLPTEDIYAIYAGWHAEHEEIQETDAAQFTADQRDEAEAVRRELEDIGYEEVNILKLGRFFGQPTAVAAARLAGEKGLIITSGEKMRWIPASSTPALGAEEAYLLFKGRQLLSAFGDPRP
jgi:hypothetical protein